MSNLSKTYAEAASNFPGEPMLLACTGTLFQEKYDRELKRANDMVSPEYGSFSEDERKRFGPHLARLAAWKELDIWDRNNLPMTIKAEIINSFTFMREGHKGILEKFEQERGYHLQNTDALAKLYQSVHLEKDPYFKRDALKTLADTLDKILKLPELSHMQENWGTLPPDDKIAFLQKIHNIHATSLGVSPVHVGTFTKEPFYPDSSKKSEPTYTTMQMSQDEIRVNMWVNPNSPNTDPIGLADFSNAMKSILHEGSHVKDGDLHNSQSPGMRAGYEGIFLGSKRGADSYLNAEKSGEAAYRSNPTEVHAFFVEEMAGEFFEITDPDLRSNYIAGLRAQAWEQEKRIQRDHDESQEIRLRGNDDMICIFTAGR